MFAGVRLGKIGSEEAKLWQILLQIEVSPDFLCGEISALQNSCKLYNHEIWKDAIQCKKPKL